MMKLKTSTLGFLILLVAAGLFSGCGDNKDVAGGEGIQTDNFVGRVVDTTGLPLPGVNVAFRKVSHTPDDFEVVSSMLSDADGYVKPEDVYQEDPYFVWAIDSVTGMRGLYYLGDLNGREQLIVLYPPGVLEGHIDCERQENCEVIIPGSGIRVQVDSNGNFAAEGIPAGGFVDVALQKSEQLYYSRVFLQTGMSRYVLAPMTEEVIDGLYTPGYRDAVKGRLQPDRDQALMDPLEYYLPVPGGGFRRWFPKELEDKVVWLSPRIQPADMFYSTEGQMYMLTNSDEQAVVIRLDSNWVYVDSYPLTMAEGKQILQTDDGLLVMSSYHDVNGTSDFGLIQFGDDFSNATGFQQGSEEVDMPVMMVPAGDQVLIAGYSDRAADGVGGELREAWINVWTPSEGSICAESPVADATRYSWLLGGIPLQSGTLLLGNIQTTAGRDSAFYKQMISCGQYENYPGPEVYGLQIMYPAGGDTLLAAGVDGDKVSLLLHDTAVQIELPHRGAELQAIVPDGLGGAVVAGSVSYQSRDVVVFRVNSSGELLWYRHWGSELNDHCSNAEVVGENVQLFCQTGFSGELVYSVFELELSNGL